MISILLLSMLTPVATNCQGEGSRTLTGPGSEVQNFPAEVGLANTTQQEDALRFDITLHDVQVQLAPDGVDIVDVSFPIVTFFGCRQAVSPYSEENDTLLSSDISPDSGSFELSGGSVRAFSRQIVGKITNCQDVPTIEITSFAERSGYLSPELYSWNNSNADFSYVVSAGSAP